MRIHDNFNLKHYNTFHVPAVARYFIDATEPSHLQEALAFCSAKQLPFLLIGQGSNILFRNDYAGLVIELNIKGNVVIEEDEECVLVKASCGEVWHDFVQHCLLMGWFGLENLSLIPGTVGAAPVQNIGAYGVEFSQFCERVEALDINTGEAVTFSKEQCAFAYRDSTFKKENKDRYIITAVIFRLSKQTKVNIGYGALQKSFEGVDENIITPQMVSNTVCKIRQSKLPDPEQLGNAGSFFWNPYVNETRFNELQKQYPQIPGYTEAKRVKIPAAWLIEQTGWKGYKENGVGVHKDHALVLVNYGQGTGEALCSLAEKIQASVLERFDIQLWPEVRII